MGKLAIIVLCPPRIPVSKRYGTCQSPMATGGVIEGDELLALALECIPRLARSLPAGDAVLAVLGNIEGVMDVFVRGRSSGVPRPYDGTEEWLHMHNVKSTIDLLSFGLHGARVEFFEPTAGGSAMSNIHGLIAIAPNVNVLSLSDYKPDSTIGTELLRRWGTKDITDLLEIFVAQPLPKHLCAPFEEAIRSLVVKCPNLSDRECYTQVCRVRYAERRVVGAVVEAISVAHGHTQATFVRLAETDPLHVFHTDHKGVTYPCRRFACEPPSQTLSAQVTIANLLSLGPPPPRLRNQLVRKSYDKRRKIVQALATLRVNSACAATEQTPGLAGLKHICSDVRDLVFFQGRGNPSAVDILSAMRSLELPGAVVWIREGWCQVYVAVGREYTGFGADTYEGALSRLILRTTKVRRYDFYANLSYWISAMSETGHRPVSSLASSTGDGPWVNWENIGEVRAKVLALNLGIRPETFVLSFRADEPIWAMSSESIMDVFMKLPDEQIFEDDLTPASNGWLRVIAKALHCRRWVWLATGRNVDIHEWMRKHMGSKRYEVIN
jgi:hypothetical protein